MRTEFEEVRDILIKNNISDIEEIEYGSDDFIDLFDYETKPRLAEDISKDKHQGRVDVHSHLDEDENGMSIGQGRLW